MTDSPFAVVVADTAPLLHFFDPDSKQRDAVGQALDASPHMVVSPFVLGELDYLLTVRLGVNASLKALDHVVQMTSIVRWSVPEVAPHLHEARHLVHRYQSMDGGLGIGLTDAMNVVLAREYRTDALLTFDVKHFRTVRPLTSHPAFRLLPDDL